MTSKNNERRRDCNDDGDDALSLRSRPVSKSTPARRRQQQYRAHKKTKDEADDSSGDGESDVLPTTTTGKWVQWGLRPWCLAVGLMCLPLCLLVGVCLATCSTANELASPMQTGSLASPRMLHDNSVGWLRRCNRCRGAIDFLENVSQIITREFYFRFRFVNGLLTPVALPSPQP